MNKCLHCQGKLTSPLDFWDVFNFLSNHKKVLCPLCEAGLLVYCEAEGDCVACRRKLAESEPAFIHPSEEGAFCHDCWRWLRIFDRKYLHHEYLYEYNTTLRKYLHAYKYVGDIRYAHIFKEALRNYKKVYPNYAWTVLASSPQALKRRQFHATALLLDIAGIPYLDLLAYQGDGKQQAKKNRKERIQLPQIFALHKELPSLETYEGLIIFDDIYTTGATILRAKELLQPLCDSYSIPCQSLSLGRESENLKV